MSSEVRILYELSGGVFRYYYAYKLGILKQKTQIDICPNCIGAGVHIPHGKVLINPNAIVGEGCKIYTDVTIGIRGKKNDSNAPVIGSHVFIGSGAKILGGICIADDVVVGANAVVITDVLEKGITVAGNPAHKVSDISSKQYI